MGIVAFLDSGIGGVAYLQNFMQKHPGHEIHYCADTQGFPYGTKSVIWIKKRVVNLALELISKTNCDTLSLSCNTASVVAIDEVRDALSKRDKNVSVVGVVPAVKLAIDLNYKKIYVMSTGVTASTEYIQKLIRCYGEKANFTVEGMPLLVNAVEKTILSQSIDTKNLHSLVNDVIYKAKELQSDCIVLACTHFLHIKKLLLEKIEHNNMSLAVIDSVDGVVRRIYDCTQKSTLTKTLPTFYITLDRQKKEYENFAKQNDMTYAGVIKI